jgi:flavin reductase (DIM6/NTAB) family NADH-FMN oxidoreductase RutF
VRSLEREGLSREAFRKVMGHFATGVTVLTARRGATVHGMTANAVMSVSLDPLLVLAAVDVRARMLEVLDVGQPFAVNMLAVGAEPLARRFAGQPDRPGRSRAIRFRPTGPEEAPILEEALAAVRCQVNERVPAGDHVLVLSHVTELFATPDPLEPLIFFRGRYRRLRSVPTQAEEPVEELLPEGLRLHYEEW